MSFLLQRREWFAHVLLFHNAYAGNAMSPALLDQSRIYLRMSLAAIGCMKDTFKRSNDSIMEVRYCHHVEKVPWVGSHKHKSHPCPRDYFPQTLFSVIYYFKLQRGAEYVSRIFYGSNPCFWVFPVLSNQNISRAKPCSSLLQSPWWYDISFFPELWLKWMRICFPSMTPEIFFHNYESISQMLEIRFAASQYPEMDTRLVHDIWLAFRGVYKLPTTATFPASIIFSSLILSKCGIIKNMLSRLLLQLPNFRLFPSPLKQQNNIAELAMSLSCQNTQRPTTCCPPQCTASSYIWCRLSVRQHYKKVFAHR